MANTICIKHGSSVPTTSNLAPFELGYVKDGALYINNDGTIQQLTGLTATGLVNSSNYLVIPTIPVATKKQPKILVANNSNVVYSRTPAQICSDIGAFPSSGGIVSGAATFNGAIVVGSSSYGTTDPNDAGITGTVGQLYFVLTE